MGSHGRSVQLCQNEESFFPAEKAGDTTARRIGKKSGYRQFTLLLETATVGTVAGAAQAWDNLKKETSPVCFSLVSADVTRRLCGMISGSGILAG